MSADPLFDGLKNGMSIYGYCRNNPLIYKDPTGLYDVKRGDEMWRVAQKNKTTLTEIGKLNPGVDLNHTKVGQHINLPGEKKDILGSAGNAAKGLLKGAMSLFKGKQPTRFGQRQFDSLNGTSVEGKTFNFGTGNDNALCNATSMINEISEEYTKRTGRQLTFNQASGMLRAGLIKGGLADDGTAWDPYNGAGGFFNDAWSITGLGGTWSRNDSGSRHELYKTNRYGGSHFENSSSSGRTFDVFSGNEYTIPSINSYQRRNYEFNN